MYRPPTAPPPVPSGDGQSRPSGFPGPPRPVRPMGGPPPTATGFPPYRPPSGGFPRPPHSVGPPSAPPGMKPPPPTGHPFPPRAQPGRPPSVQASMPTGPSTGPPVVRPPFGSHGSQPPVSGQSPQRPLVPPPGTTIQPTGIRHPSPIPGRPIGHQPPVPASRFPTMAPTPPGPFSNANRPSSPKIDPAQIPRSTHSESDPPITFETRHNGQHQIPPAAFVRSICKDVGNCDPKFMRLSMNHVPASSELCTNVALPLVVFMQPLALQNPEEQPISVVDFGEAGPVRCGRCRAYINPFMYFQDGGRSFVCVFCNVKNETPADYFCYLGHDGKRRDAHERPELSKGTVEFVAPPSFMVRPPMPPVHFFLIDATSTAIGCGALHATCNHLKTAINSIQGRDRALVGIATFDTSIQFYHVKNAEGTPQVLVVSDITEVFAPLPTLLIPLAEGKDSIFEMLDLIPKLYEHQTNGESCAGAAVEAAIEALKPTGGKLHVVLTTRPTRGTRALKPRDVSVPHSADKADKEKQMVLLPQDNTYRTLGLRASEMFVSIDLFCLAQNYVDVGTFGILSNTTGGHIYYYEKFTVQHDGQQFLNDLQWNLRRPQGLEAVLRLRCSTGLDIESYLGSMTVRNQHEIEIPSLDADSAIMAKILYDDKLQEGSEAYFQCALLYTTTSGQRRIRVSTLGVPITANANQVFRGADLESFVNYLARRVSVTIPGNTLQQAKETITNGCAGPLTAYRKYCATSSSTSGQLILPDSMKLLPLYTLGLLKSTALRFDARPDERSAFLSLLLSLPCSKILNLVYGRFFMLDPILQSDQVTIPDSLSLSSEHLRESKLFLFENGREMLIKVESQVPSEMLQALFGIPQVNIKAPEPSVIVSDHSANSKLHKLLTALRMRAGAYMSLRIVFRSTPSEANFLGYLIEDRNAYGQSYVEHLCTVHRRIQTRLS